MPGWNKKEERQYKHIVKSCRRTGRSAKACKRIAAATVNKHAGLDGFFSDNAVPLTVFGGALAIGTALVVASKAKAQP